MILQWFDIFYINLKPTIPWPSKDKDFLSILKVPPGAVDLGVANLVNDVW